MPTRFAFFDKRAAHFLRRGGRLFAIEMILPEDGSSGALCDLHLLAATGGSERTESDYAALFDQAGFDFRGMRALPTVPSVILGVVRRVDACGSGSPREFRHKRQDGLRRAFQCPFRCGLAATDQTSCTRSCTGRQPEAQSRVESPPRPGQRQRHAGNLARSPRLDSRPKSRE